MTVPQPHRPADLIIQGAGSLGQGISNYQTAQRQQEQEAAPIHPAMQGFIEHYIGRIQQGEDPQKVAEEARANLPQLIDTRLQQPRAPAPAGVVPDVGMQGGAPSLGAPGQFSPSGGPQGPAGQAPMQAPAQGPAQGPSLGALPPANYAVPGPGGSQIQVSRPGPEQAQAPAGPAPQRQPMAPISNRQFREQFQPVLPTIVAAQGRQEAARTTSQGQLERARLNAEKDTLLAVVKENGLDQRAYDKALLAMEGLDDRQQQALLRAMTDLAKARISAGATTGAAGIRAGAGGESQDLKAIVDTAKSLRSLIGTYSRADKTFMLPGLNITLGQAEQDLARYDAEIAKRTNMAPRSQANQPEFQPPEGTSAVPRPEEKVKAPQPKAKPAPVVTQAPAASSKKIKVRLKDGRTGTIPESSFNPATMTRL